MEVFGFSDLPAPAFRIARGSVKFPRRICQGHNNGAGNPRLFGRRMFWSLADLDRTLRAMGVSRRWIGTPDRHPKGALTHFWCSSDVSCCESAWGPDADWHHKLLIHLALEGSRFGAYSHPEFRGRSPTNCKASRRLPRWQNFLFSACAA